MSSGDDRRRPQCDPAADHPRAAASASHVKGHDLGRSAESQVVEHRCPACRGTRSTRSITQAAGRSSAPSSGQTPRNARRLSINSRPLCWLGVLRRITNSTVRRSTRSSGKPASARRRPAVRGTRPLSPPTFVGNLCLGRLSDRPASQLGRILMMHANNRRSTRATAGVIKQITGFDLRRRPPGRSGRSTFERTVRRQPNGRVSVLSDPLEPDLGRRRGSTVWRGGGSPLPPEHRRSVPEDRGKFVRQMTQAAHGVVVSVSWFSCRGQGSSIAGTSAVGATQMCSTCG